MTRPKALRDDVRRFIERRIDGIEPASILVLVVGLVWDMESTCIRF